MRFTRIRAAFLVAVTLAFASSLSQGKLYANGNSYSVVDAMRATAPASMYLTVTVTCDQTFGILWTCEAVASGGSGPYSFTWYNASVQSEFGETSTASGPCGGDWQYVRVTDSLGNYLETSGRCFREW
jgi:hypothetical protein